MAGSGSRSLVAQGYVKVRADASELPGDMEKIKTTFRNSLMNMSTVTGGILAAAGIRGLTGLFSAAANQIASASAIMENFTISLGVLLKSDTQAKSLMAQIEKIAAVTPFTTQSLAEAVVQLKVFGFETKKLLPMMQTIGNAAAASPRGMADGLQRISYALGQINTAGKVSRRELRQLTMAGVAAWDFLAAKLGKSKDQISAMVKAGQMSAKVAIEAILEGMDKKFGGMMKKQSRTWTGLLSTLTDDLRIFARQAGEPLFDVAKWGLTSVIDWFEGKQAKALIDNIKSSTEKVINLIKSGLNSPWVPVIGKILKAALAASTLAGSIGFAVTAVSGLQTALGFVISPMGMLFSLATAVAYAFQEALNGPQGQKLQITLNEISVLAREVGHNLMRAFGEFTDWVSRTWVSLFGNDLKTSQATFFQSLLDWIRRAMDFISLLTVDMGLAWEYMQVTAKLAWIKAQEYGQIAFAQLKTWANDFWETMKQLAAEGWEQFKVLAAGAFESLAQYMGTSTDKIIAMGTAIGELAGKIVTLAEKFGSLAIGAFIVTEITGALSGLMGIVGALAPMLVALGIPLAPAGIVIAGLGLLAAGFVAAKIEGVSFGEYMSMLFGRLVSGCKQAQDAVSRLKREMKNEDDYNDQSRRIEAAMKGTVTDDKKTALEEELNNSKEREERLREKMPKLEEAAMREADAAEHGGTSDAAAHEFETAKADLTRQEQRTRQIEEMLKGRKAEAKARNALKDFVDSAVGIKDRIASEAEKKRLTGSQESIASGMEYKRDQQREVDEKQRKSMEFWGIAAEKATPVFEPGAGGDEPTKRKKTPKEMREDAQFALKEAQREEKAKRRKDIEDEKRRKRDAMLVRMGRKLPDDEFSGGEDNGTVNKKGAGQHQMSGIMEFAKMIQSSLNKSAADEAAEKTADATGKMAELIEQIKNGGIPITKIPPVPATAS